VEASTHDAPVGYLISKFGRELSTLGAVSPETSVGGVL
jgi:hypothetical protein